MADIVRRRLRNDPSTSLLEDLAIDPSISEIGERLPDDEPVAPPAEPQEDSLSLSEALNAPAENPPSLRKDLSAPRSPGAARGGQQATGPSRRDDINARRQAIIQGLEPASPQEKADATSDLLQDQIAKMDNSDQGKKVKETMTRLDGEIKNAHSLMRDKETRSEWLSALENIGQAMTQYAAAKYGMEHGVNLSGLKQQKTDWAGMLAAAQRRMESELADLRSMRQEAAAEGKELRGLGTTAAMAGMSAADAEARERRGLEMAGLAAEQQANEHAQTLQTQRDIAAMKVGAAGAGREDKSSKDLRTMELKAAAEDFKREQVAEKAAKGALGTIANLLSNPTKKIEDKDQQLMKKELANAGIDLDKVSVEKGLFFTDKIVDLNAASKAVKARISEINNSQRQLREYAAKVASARDMDALNAVREARYGGAFAAPAAAEQPAASGSSSSGLKAGDIVEQNGIRYQYDGKSFNPIKK